MIKLQRQILALAGAALLLAGCESGPELRSDYDTAADFGQYRTYNFLTDSSQAKTLALQSMQRSAAREMEKRGYTRSENPDLALNFRGKMEEKTDIESTPAPMYGAGFGYGGWYGAPYGGWGVSSSQQVSTRRYNVGTLVMDVVDTKKKQVVYQGVIQDVVTKKMQQDVAGTIDNAVTTLFAKYPFVAGQSGKVALPATN